MDLEETISLHREAVELTPVGHPNKSVFINNLAGVLRICFEHSGKPRDLEEAILLEQEAKNLTLSASV